MAFAICIGLVAGYAWSVRLLYRQAHDVRPTVAGEMPVATRVRVVQSAARVAAPPGVFRARRPGSTL